MPAAPPSLYKYVSVETARAVLKNCTLRWSTPGTFNDPFDMQLPLVLKIEDDVVVALALEKISKAFEGESFLPANEVGSMFKLMRAKGIRLSRDEIDSKFRETLRRSMSKLRTGLPTFNKEMIDGLSNSKILCLSESPLISTMWSHYADNHHSVVLEFGTPNGIDSPWKMARPVKYRNAPPNFADVEVLANVLAGMAKFSVQETSDLFVYTKSTDWEYEKEWRIFSGSGRNSGAEFEDIAFHPQEFVGLIFGCRTSEEVVAEFSELAWMLNPEISVKQVKKSGINLTLR